MKRLGLQRAKPLCLAAMFALAGACGGDESNPGMQEVTPPADGGPIVTDDASTMMQNDAGPTMPVHFNGRANGYVYTLARVGNSLFLGGQFSAVSATPRESLALLSTEGNLVSGCDLGGGFDGDVLAIARTSTAIYVGGNFAHYRGAPVNSLAKIDATTCALDTVFSPPTANGVTGSGRRVSALHINGSSLYIGGYFSMYRGVADSAMSLAKVDLLTGAQDTTFSPVGANNNGVGTGYVVYSLTSNATDLFIGGYFLKYRNVNNSARNLAKVNLATGVQDATFSPATSTTSNGFDQYVAVVAMGPNGALYVGGAFSTYKNATSSAYRIAKLDPTTGALDTTFSPPSNNGFNVDSQDVVRALAFDGTSLYVGGRMVGYRNVQNSSFAIAKLDPTSGAIDTTFSPPGLTSQGFNATVHSLSVANGFVYAGGEFTSYRGVATAARSIAKINTGTGVLDDSFRQTGESGRGFDAQVFAVVAQGSNVAVGGNFHQYGGTSATNIAKVDIKTGEVDAAFSPAASNGFNGPVFALAADGNSIFATGDFTAYRGVAASANRIAKLDTTSGALDTTFGPQINNGFDRYGRALAIANGSVYVGGAFTTYRGVAGSANYLAKLDATSGAIDQTFGPSGANSNGFDDEVSALSVLGNAVYAGGRFAKYRNVSDSAFGIAKLDTTSGAIDTTFSPPGFANNGFDDEVHYLLASGNAVYVGGEFQGYRGGTNSAHGIAKLDATTGALDTVFSGMPGPNNGFDSDVYTLALAGTSLYVGGDFENYRGTAPNAERLAKLDTTTGALDTTFTMAGEGSGTDQEVNALVLDGDHVLIGGAFSRYKTTTVYSVARLKTSDGTSD